MSEPKLVALTVVNCHGLSRQELLNFINSITGGNYTKVEQLCTGIAYCQILEQLFPNSIGQNRLKTDAKLEHEMFQNWRLLQLAFSKLNYEKNVPIDRLIKGRFQDNFEFLQWFKKFFDTVQGKENCSQAANSNDKPTKISARKPFDKQKAAQNVNFDAADHETVVNQSLVEVKHQIEKVTEERNYYFKRAAAIETLVKQQKESNQHVDMCERILQILYGTQEDRKAAAEEAVEPVNGVV